jgi:serine/threonine protein kinase
MNILEAFNQIHEHGVVHHDVRPDNILVSESGNSVWIIDFECAGDGDESSYEHEREVVTDLMNKVRGEDKFW